MATQKKPLLTIVDDVSGETIVAAHADGPTMHVMMPMGTARWVVWAIDRFAHTSSTRTRRRAAGVAQAVAVAVAQVDRVQPVPTSSARWDRPPAPQTAQAFRCARLLCKKIIRLTRHGTTRAAAFDVRRSLALDRTLLEFWLEQGQVLAARYRCFPGRASLGLPMLSCVVRVSAAPGDTDVEGTGDNTPNAGARGTSRPAETEDIGGAQGGAQGGTKGGTKGDWTLPLTVKDLVARHGLDEAQVSRCACHLAWRCAAAWRPPAHLWRPLLACVLFLLQRRMGTPRLFVSQGAFEAGATQFIELWDATPAWISRGAIMTDVAALDRACVAEAWPCAAAAGVMLCS
jgi:hypothetical protein